MISSGTFAVFVAVGYLQFPGKKAGVLWVCLCWHDARERAKHGLSVYGTDTCKPIKTGLSGLSGHQSGNWYPKTMAGLNGPGGLSSACLSGITMLAPTLFQTPVDWRPFQKNQRPAQTLFPCDPSGGRPAGWCRSRQMDPGLGRRGRRAR